MNTFASSCRLFVAATLSGTLIFFTIVHVHAQPQEMQSARDEVQDAIHDIEQVGNADDAAIATLKKDALVKIIAFSKLEGERVLADIHGLSLENSRPEFNIIQKTFTEELEKAVAHFSAVLSALTESQTPSTRELEIVASSFREWRATTYDSLVKSSLNLTIIVRTEETLLTAEARLTKVSAAAKKIPALASNKPFETLLTDAGLNLRNARSLLNRAQDALLRARLPLPDMHVSRTPAAALSAIQLTPSQKKTPPEHEVETRQLIEQGLRAIKDAYGKFIEMNKLVTDLVGDRARQ